MFGGGLLILRQILHNDYKIGLILKNVFINEKIALLNELLFIKFVFFLLGPEIETFWSILIIKQYFAECVFVLGASSCFNK